MTHRLRPALVAASLACAVAVALLTSCAYPSVELQSARLDSIRLSGLSVDLFLNVNNPNQFDLPLEEVEWSLQLFDIQVGTGASRLDRNLPAQQTTRVRMPITVGFGDAAAVTSELRSSRSIPWALDGTATFQAPTGPLSLDFADGGRWDNPLR